MNRILVLIFISIVFTFSCKEKDNDKKKDADVVASNEPAAIAFSIVKTFAHDTNSFTEGLVFHNGQLFEATGHTNSYPNSRSLFGVLDTATGKIAIKAEIDKNKYFGEGIVFLHDKIYQLTDTTRIGFVYDAKTFKQTGDFHYTGDGWALTTDGTYLIMSNGSSNIVYRNTESFAIVKTISVTDNNGPVSNINELELINGFIYANQWLSNYILKIDTATGKVVGKLDLDELAADAKKIYPGAEETNGIAYDSATNRIIVTGKLWPKAYEISFAH